MPGEKKQITRNRASYSCQKCRQRKVKCDKVHPICGSCQKTGEECVYASNDSENSAENISQTVDVGLGKKRKSGLEDLDHDNTVHNDASRPSIDLEAQLSQLSGLLDQLSNIAGIRTCQRIGNEDPDGARINRGQCLTPELRAACDGGNVSQLDARQGQYVSSSTMASKQNPEPGRLPKLDTISAQLDQLTSLLRHHKVDTVSDNNNKSNATQSKVPFDMDEVLYVPNEHQRNPLFRCWLSSVFPVMPIADPITCLMHYRTFHFWYTYGLEKGIPNPVEEFVPLIYAIYLAGAASMSVRGIHKWFPGLSKSRVLEGFRKQLVLVLKGPTRSLTNPAALAARVMLCYLSPSDVEDAGLISSSAPLVRLAYSCNLHRERSNETLDKNLAEVRRRLWWEICSLDVLEACASNIPPSINHHFSDTYMLSEIKDAKIRVLGADNGDEASLLRRRFTEAADDPSTNVRTSPVSVIYLWMKARTMLASAATRVLNINLTARPRTKEDMAELTKGLRDVERDIESIIDRIPTKGIPEQDFMPDINKPGQSVSHDHGSLYGDDLISIEVEAVCGSVSECEKWEWPYVQQYRNSMVAFHKWARIALSMMIDTCYCLSFAPFLSQSKRKLWRSARQCALRHAHSCLRKFNALAGDIELERFRWAWSSMFQPTHACIIILLDTHEQPHSIEAARSRALFDQMMSLSSPDYGIVGGSDGITNKIPLQGSGDEAFRMLMQLRAKAWHKAGLDPRRLWTEQDQIDIGVTAPPTEAEKMARSFREDRIISSSFGTGHPSPASKGSLHALCEPRAHQATHPAEVSIPEHEGHIESIVHDEQPSDEVPPNRCNGANNQRYRYARDEQPRMPFHCSGTRRCQKTGRYRRQGHLYPLKPPSEIFDIDQLIQKIRSVRQSNQAEGGAQAPESSALFDRIATANSDLTSFLVRNGIIDGGHDADANNHGNGNVHANVDDTVPSLPSSSNRHNVFDDIASALSPPPPSPPARITLQHLQQHLQRQQQYMANDPIESTTATTTNTMPMNKDPDPNPEPNQTLDPEPDPDLNVTDMLNMDFDWAKWDEIFGHILDEDISCTVDETAGTTTMNNLDPDWDWGS